MRLLIWDMEVFRYDSLLGCYILEDDKDPVLYQTWDLDEMRKFYAFHQQDIWIGWNSNNYDDLILEAIYKKQDPYVKSKEIVDGERKQFCHFQLNSYDLLNGLLVLPSLKLTEALVGKPIDTTEVDFDLNRPLTDEEKQQTEKYNKSDLNQTLFNFKKFYNKFELRLSLIKEFGIPLQKGLRMTGTQIAAAALHAKRNPALKYDPVLPSLPKTLRIKNQELIDWFLQSKGRDGEILTLHLCNTDVTIAFGGAHSTCKKYHCKKAIYADISGYYNLIMILFDLLPRTLDEEGKKKYEFMYHEQLRLKKIDPVKRNIYKTICLSVFGAMNNEYSDFYDPWKFGLVTTTGEMFLMDLLEKLDGLVTAFNINTDGIMVEPLDWNDEEKIFGIINEWVERNGFQVKTGIITDYHGRDVNCYVMRELDGGICTKGDVLKNYDISDKAYASASFFNCKEPPIIAQAIVECFMNNVMPETYVEEHKYEVNLFQYVCKKGGFDYLTYDVTTRDGKTSDKIQSPTRVFASKNPNAIGKIIKHRINKKGLAQAATLGSLPDNVFIWNKEILTNESILAISDLLDYDYYINRIYKKINEFL